jgi:glycosyltransferase involved in cell wall biosynthesis
MRIAYVTETWDPSVDGVVTRLRATLRELHRRGHETLVIAPAPGWTPRSQDGVVEMRAIGFSFLGGGKPLGVPHGRRVTELIADYSPDLVHVLNPFVLGTAGVQAARRTGLPLVASFHQDIAAVARHYRVGFLGNIIWAHVRRLHRRAALNLATSAAMAAELEAHRIERVDLWPYGVDLERFNPRRRNAEARQALLDGGSRDRGGGMHGGSRLDDGSGVKGGDSGDRAGVVALYVGRLAPEKNVQRLVPLSATPGVTLVLVGDGPLRRPLEEHMSGPNVRFTGWLAGDELADAYAGADVFVFPSTTETLGLVQIEALASGLPVIAAKSAPSAEILGDGAGGMLLDENDWARLPEAVLEMGTPGSTWQARSLAARQRAEAWGWAASTEFLLDRYQQVIAGVGSGGRRRTIGSGGAAGADRRAS